MRLPDKDRILSFAVVLALTTVLVVLAVLQYRWSAQVSEAASERMKANLQTAMLHFRDGLAHELGGIALALQFDSQSTMPAVYAEQIEEWKQNAAYPELVSNVYLWKADGDGSRFEHLNFQTLQFEACARPSGFERLAEPLQEFASRAATHQPGDEYRRMLARETRSLAAPLPIRQKAAEAADASDPTAQIASAAPMRAMTERPATAERSPESASVRAERNPDRTGGDDVSLAASARQQTTDMPERERSFSSDDAWARRRGRVQWGFGRRSPGPLERRQEKSSTFSAFGLPAEGQRSIDFTSKRRPVAVRPGSGQAFSSLDATSAFNRPLIVPDHLFDRQDTRTERALADALGKERSPEPVRELEGQGPADNMIPAPLLPGAATMSGPPHPASGERQQPGGRQRLHLSPWFVETSIPALLRPKFQPQRHGPAGRGLPEGDWIVVELNRKVLQEKVFPELVERYFAGPEGTYDVAVKAALENELIYASAAGFGKDLNVAADAQLGIFGSPGGPSGPIRVFFAGDRPPQAEPPYDGPAWARRRATGPVLIPFQGGAAEGWVLLARHRKGSLEAAVAGMRRRNLGISFGVLLILGFTMAMVIVNTRRAQRLATLQMDFVAGVSHELRTPLAVISSAADNIADGIVSDKVRLARYGKLIRDHSRQLTDLVEQILSFAATRQQNHQYNLVRVQPSEFVDAALHNSSEMIRSAGFTLEKDLAPDLPYVAVDISAATRCLQNLISNAVKYGGEQRWIRVRAHSLDSEVQISVEDKGIGMEPEELRRIFEPFYRAPAVVSAQIRGTGLGLALAKTMAQAFGGRLTATSRPGKGSTFTLHLPCAEEHTNLDQTSAAGLS